MLSLAPLLSLPRSLLLLILASSIPTAIPADLQWPVNLPAGMRYFPEDEPLVKRGLESLKKLQYQRPIGVKKMSSDPNEMFFLDYWEFNETSANPDQCPIDESQYLVSLNGSSSDILRPPALLHSPHTSDSRKLARFLAPFNNLAKRDLQCPTGYSNCASITAPSVCCPTGQTCINIQNNGAGGVGCCPSGSNCANTVGPCNTNLGYQSCSGSANNQGCCISGFTCLSTGCKSSMTLLSPYHSNSS
jgi:progranulin